MTTWNARFNGQGGSIVAFRTQGQNVLSFAVGICDCVQNALKWGRVHIQSHRGNDVQFAQGEIVVHGPWGDNQSGKENSETGGEKNLEFDLIEDVSTEKYICRSLQKTFQAFLEFYTRTKPMAGVSQEVLFWKTSEAEGSFL